MDQVERANEQSVYKQSIKKWRGGEGGRERKKIGERIRIRKRTMKESKRTKQRANVLRCMNRKEKVEKTARTK